MTICPQGVLQMGLLVLASVGSQAEVGSRPAQGMACHLGVEMVDHLVVEGTERRHQRWASVGRVWRLAGLGKEGVESRGRLVLFIYVTFM